VRIVVALTLLMAGLGVCVWGLLGAVEPIAGLYASALDDPLGERAAPPEARDVADRAWRSALIGMAGVPPMLIGSWMLWGAVLRRLRPARAR
jgi:hypothetical protein